MKKFAFVLALLLTNLVLLAIGVEGTAFAAASQQGCESSGNTAAGCGTNVTVTPTVTNTTENTNVNLNANRNTNDSRAHAVGIGVGVGGRAVQSQSAEGGAGGAGGQGGTGGNANSTSSSSTTSTANNAGNQQSVTVSNTAPDKLRTVGQPAAIVTNTTANCRSAVGVNAGWLGGVFGFGTTVADETCQLIELSKRLEAVGLVDPSIQIMCQDERAKKAMGPICVE